MRKRKSILIVSFVCIIAIPLSATRLSEYNASNGVFYKIGDTVKLGRGSNTNGKFNYITYGGLMATSDPEQNKLTSGWAGYNVIIKKIASYSVKGSTKIYFTVSGTIGNLILDVENAIETCEIMPCKETNKPIIIDQREEDKYDKLKKLKELLDSNIITQEEFEKEKAKLLENE